MVQFVNALMVERRGRLVDALLGLVFLCILLACLTLFARYRMQQEVEHQNGALIAEFAEREQKIRDIFTGLRAQVTAPPCSPEFQVQLRRFAFLPDGISEFFYAPNGNVLCSNTNPHPAEPIALGVPDLLYGVDAPVWMNRDLSAFGLDNLSGSLVLRSDMGFIVPRQKSAVPEPAWLDFETVLIGPDGRRWHRDGGEGVYDMVVEGSDRALDTMTCNRERFCVASRTHVIRFLAGHRLELAFFALLLAVLEVAVAMGLKAWIRKYCSFENRFRRHLEPGSIVCAYQPVMDFASGRIVGCEVLARWRDVDGSIVFPDRFIPLVERDRTTLAFTRAIVGKAMSELSAALPADLPLQVAFNVFPADLSDARLPDVFRICREGDGRFSIIAEIVESAALAAEEARSQIEALRREGVRVYLDDFGSGYSNIQNIAALPIEGVKLDRAFAMAPDDSLMARMLAHAIGLIKVSGRTIVVEGVETAAKLDALRALVPAVDRVQGYHVSRPLPIEAFAAFVIAASQDVESMPEAA